jgi:hypothetical protein
MSYFYDRFTHDQPYTDPSIQLSGPKEGVSNPCTRSIPRIPTGDTIDNGHFEFTIPNADLGKFCFLKYDFNSVSSFPAMIITTTLDIIPSGVTFYLDFYLPSDTIIPSTVTISGKTLSFETPEIEKVISFHFSSFNASSNSYRLTFSKGLIGGPTCISGDSLVLTKQSYKPISQLQRGDEIEGGKIAAIIKDELPSYVTLVKIGNVKTCSNHVLIHNGKRILAKNHPDAEIISGKTEDLLPDPYLYDIQFDFEGSYFLEGGLESQSRSPYCHLTPLAKEKYFNLDNYRSVRVDNTLRLDPPFN